MAYSPTTWTTNEVITKDKLNKIEQGINTASKLSGTDIDTDKDWNGKNIINVNDFSASTFRTKCCVASSELADRRVYLPGRYSGGYNGRQIEICRLPPYTWEAMNSFEISFTLEPGQSSGTSSQFTLTVGGVVKGVWEKGYAGTSERYTVTIKDVKGSDSVVATIRSTFNDTTRYGHVNDIEIRAVDQDRIINLKDMPSTWVNW
ncbi:MAG: hypothetical protein WC343_08735 [Bacilli bacterium]|jgi:hypothetical protein